MDELGTILREARQARGLTLEDVAQVTRIRVRYLEALEEGRYDVLPTPVHVRGFLRNYALYLDLEPDPLIARYGASRRVVQDIPLKKQVRPELERVAPPPPETLENELEAEPVFFRPLGSRLHAPAWFSGDILIGVLIIVVLAALILWAGGRFLLPLLTGEEPLETPVAEVTSQATRRSTSTPGTQATPGQEVELQTPGPTSPPIFSSIQLEVAVLDRGWLLVVADGETVHEGMAESGDAFAWEAADVVKLRSGNAGGIQVILNGQDLGELGGRGEVVEKIWGLSGEIPPTPMPTPTVTATQVPVPTEPITSTATTSP